MLHAEVSVNRHLRRDRKNSLNHYQVRPTNMRRLLLTLAATIISFVAFAQEERGVGYPTVAAALEALKARSDVNISVQGGWTIVDDKPTNTIWSFTPPNHPAHPAVVKRAVVSRDGAVGIDMTALCQASKAACDKLMEEFKELNARMSQSMSGKVAGPQRIRPSEIDVQRLSNDSFHLVLKSYSSRTVEAGQQELLPKAKEVCGAKDVGYGKYQFETLEPVNSIAPNGPALVLKQNIVCGPTAGAQAPAESPKNADGQWHPATAQVQRVELQSNAYFAAKDGRRYKEAYELLSPASKQITPFERWSSVAENFKSKMGDVLHRDIKKITWYKNPPQAAPGTYAAVDFSSQFTNASIHCGYLVWFEQGDGSFLIVREEENFIDKATEQKLKPDELERVRAQFGCKG